MSAPDSSIATAIASDVAMSGYPSVTNGASAALPSTFSAPSVASIRFVITFTFLSCPSTWHS